MVDLAAAIIAYLPHRHEALEATTRRACASLEQFGRLSSHGRVTVFHSQDHTRNETLCREVHPILGNSDVVDYVQGSVGRCYKALMDRAFNELHAEWSLFSGNDVVWRPEAWKGVLDLFDAGMMDPMVNYVYPALAVSLVSRKLWEAMAPNLFVSYFTYSWEDCDLALQTYAVGGIQRRLFDGLLDHEGQATVRHLGSDTMHQGFRRQHWDANKRIFESRYPWSPDVCGNPPPEVIAEVRAHPVRPLAYHPDPIGGFTVD